MFRAYPFRGGLQLDGKASQDEMDQDMKGLSTQSELPQDPAVHHPSDSASNFSTVPVLGYPLAATTYEEAVDYCYQLAMAEGVHFVEAANTMVVTLARHDDSFSAAMSKFDCWLPDGMPLVWLMNRSLNENLSDRVYGPTFMLRCLEQLQTREEVGHFLLGGKESTLEKLEQRFSSEFPGSRIMGTYSPPFGQWPDDEDERICEAIRESGAKFVWVGLGCPKQELWMAKVRELLPDGVYFGIGAAFAFHAGEVKQAPAFLQSHGLEWLYRMCMEPRRLFSRYFKFNSLFLYYLMRDKLLGRPA